MLSRRLIRPRKLVQKRPVTKVLAMKYKSDVALHQAVPQTVSHLVNFSMKGLFEPIPKEITNVGVEIMKCERKRQMNHELYNVLNDTMTEVKKARAMPEYRQIHVFRVLFDAIMLPYYTQNVIVDSADPTAKETMVTAPIICQMHEILRSFLPAIADDNITAILYPKDICTIINQICLPDDSVRMSSCDLCSMFCVRSPAFRPLIVANIASRLIEAVDTKKYGYSVGSLLFLLHKISDSQTLMKLFRPVLLPLLTHPSLAIFVSRLQFLFVVIITADSQKQNDLLDFICNHWPKINSNKAVALLGIINATYGLVHPSQRINDLLLMRMLESIQMGHQALMIAAVEFMKTTTFAKATNPLLSYHSKALKAAKATALNHWEPEVRDLARFIPEKSSKITRSTTETWKRIKGMALANGYKK